MEQAIWNLWHGCHKYSEGCKYCYVYRSDARYERDASRVYKMSDFSLPVKKDRAGEYKIPSGTTVNTCFTSDFLLEDADEWRASAWDMIRERRDLDFFFITKRITRFMECVPSDWGEGWSNVAIGCTCENQRAADERLPVFQKLPIASKYIIDEPLLEHIDLSPYLGKWVTKVVAGGESGLEARVCDFDWILSLGEQCRRASVPFYFKQTGAHFIKNGKLYNIPRRLQHQQARKANVNILCGRLYGKD